MHMYACNLHTITLIDLHHPFIIHDALCFCKRIIAFQLRHKPPKEEEASSQIFLKLQENFYSKLYSAAQVMMMNT